MKKIPLTQGKFALVDDEDYDRLVAMGKWHLDNRGYGRRTKNYTKKDGGIKPMAILMHREIMGLHYGNKLEVDHISGDRLDNRKCNLRVCSKTENIRNEGLRKNNKSTYKGVSFKIKNNKFQAKIGFNSKQIYLGLFDDPKEAAKAYNKAAIKYFGDFANLNQIPA